MPATGSADRGDNPSAARIARNPAAAGQMASTWPPKTNLGIGPY
jgi:hypothetical protein